MTSMDFEWRIIFDIYYLRFYNYDIPVLRSELSRLVITIYVASFTFHLSNAWRHSQYELGDMSQLYIIDNQWVRTDTYTIKIISSNGQLAI